MRKFEVAVAAPSTTVEQALTAFGTPEYWLDRFAEFGGGLELTRCEVDQAGRVRVETLQDVSRDVMHPLLGKLYPRDIRVITTEVWVPRDDDAVGTVTVAVQGAPGEGEAQAHLTPAGEGSSLRFSGQVRVRVPLLGGPIERVVAGQIAAHIPDMQRFTSRWVHDHG